jgi:hypothetical protein
MKKLLAIGLVLFACDQPHASADVYHAPGFHVVEGDHRHDYEGVMHDGERNVTCWFAQRNVDGTYPAVALSCIPDWQLSPPKGVEAPSGASLGAGPVRALP